MSSTWEELAASAEFGVSRMAKLCGISTRTLQRHFKQRHGMNVSDWLKTVRLNEARILLSTAGAVKEVAYTLHYKQASHFAREFKLRFGVCPHTLLGGSKWRELAALSLVANLQLAAAPVRREGLVISFLPVS